MSDQQGFVSIEDELPLSGTALAELMQDVLTKGKVFRFRANGFSMSPFIQDGDLISLSPLLDAPPKMGEAVAFIDPETNKLIVHRIVSKDQNAYLILGDNQIEPGYDTIQIGNILGRVTGVERNGKVVRLGLGPEKYLIAHFSRARLLQPLIAGLAPLIRHFRRAV